MGSIARLLREDTKRPWYACGRAMTTEDAQDYLATVEERRHLEGMIERGRKEFSGYGLELFERGLRGKIAKLTDAITQRNAQSGHNLVASDWSGHENRALTCNVAGQYITPPSSVSNFSNCVVLSCNVQMLQGPINLYRVQLKPACVYVPLPEDRMDILGVPGMLGRSSEVHVDKRCYLPV